MASGDAFPALFLTGATASGKSAVALALAHLIGGEVVCADAFQLYAGVPVLTAQPTPREVASVPHHLYGSVPVSEEMNASRYALMAAAAVAEVQSRGRFPIVTGGSGLYVKSLTHGLAALPPADPALRAELESLATGELTSRLLAIDPAAARTLNPNNRRHIQRALEITLLTGRPASELKSNFASGPRPGIRGFFLERDRRELYERINQRTHQMLQDGILNEIRNLPPADLSATARKTIGYEELYGVITGQLALEAAIAAIQQATRHYAKRQLTWFRRETWMQHLDATKREPEEIARDIAAGL